MIEDTALRTSLIGDVASAIRFKIATKDATASQVLEAAKHVVAVLHGDDGIEIKPRLRPPPPPGFHRKPNPPRKRGINVNH